MKLRNINNRIDGIDKAYYIQADFLVLIKAIKSSLLGNRLETSAIVNRGTNSKQHI